MLKLVPVMPVTLDVGPRRKCTQGVKEMLRASQSSWGQTMAGIKCIQLPSSTIVNA